MFEKLLLFAFKNCKNVLFVGKLLAKLPAKIPEALISFQG